jgi:hypothetical protein
VSDLVLPPAPARQHEHDVEGAERVERAEEHRHEQDRLHERPGDAREGLESRGAVHRGGLVEIGRDGQEARVAEQRHERRRAPHVGQDERRQGQIRIAEPVIARP